MFLAATQQRVATKQTVAVAEAVFGIGLFLTVDGHRVGADHGARLAA